MNNSPDVIKEFTVPTTYHTLRKVGPLCHSRYVYPDGSFTWYPRLALGVGYPIMGTFGTRETPTKRQYIMRISREFACVSALNHASKDRRALEFFLKCVNDDTFTRVVRDARRYNIVWPFLDAASAVLGCNYQRHVAHFKAEAESFRVTDGTARVFFQTVFGNPTVPFGVCGPSLRLLGIEDRSSGKRARTGEETLVHVPKRRRIFPFSADHEPRETTVPDSDVRARPPTWTCGVGTPAKCPVCYEKGPESFCFYFCGHYVCTPCHEKWFPKGKHCPACRATPRTYLHVMERLEGEKIEDLKKWGTGTRIIA